ncbi:UNVERIFIED_CONTAM: hypothetical protein HDU68_003416 [Siphonaria sp. JEL0065]|nr:hypothetical protein HDU68_003416 [Siphonaria sp. JEL0065]
MLGTKVALTFNRAVVAAPRFVFQRSGATTFSVATKSGAFSFNSRFYSAGPAPLGKDQVQERVLNVLRDFDKVDASKLTLDSHFITDLGLDSLDQVEITIAIEEEFNIELSDKDADDILTPRAAADKVCLRLFPSFLVDPICLECLI